MIPDALQQLRTHLDSREHQHRAALAGWEEPNGFLVSSEPDADERRRIRDCLQAALSEIARLREVLSRVLSVKAGVVEARVPHEPPARFVPFELVKRALEEVAAQANLCAGHVGITQRQRDWLRSEVRAVAQGELAKLEAQASRPAPPLGWQPITEALDADEEVLMWTPRERIYTKEQLAAFPDLPRGEQRVSTRRMWTWATHYKPLSAPPAAHAAPTE